ncbi:MAG: 23S rRNA (pseudouridine(1915)-N(3))-methyltransferase RlmH [Candidatus Pacebacteria bacterium]|nr:23S rRNA (pseudouridine(1915)-N(3))-methyltransferase RlmH [Candidatus Paceibacterota bacterium]
MKFQIITIGKKHDKDLENLILDFEKRIKKNFDLSWHILKSEDDKDKDVQKKKESEKILEFLKKEISSNSFVILLDEKGKEKSTKELSNLFEEKMNRGIDKIIFIIGGAFGVEEKISEKANLILSLSKLVFPHQIVRLILIEQIYRCISILKNEKYHHE